MSQNAFLLLVVEHEAVVVHGKQAVLLVPDELALARAGLVMSIVHQAFGIHIYKISVPVVCVNMVVLHIVLSRSLLGTVIHILDTCKLELLSVFRTICVLQVISDIERAVELHVVLGQMLALGSDAVHVVVAKRWYAHTHKMRCPDYPETHFHYLRYCLISKAAHFPNQRGIPSLSHRH